MSINDFLGAPRSSARKSRDPDGKTPMGIYLDNPVVDALDDIAAVTGRSRSATLRALLAFAVAEWRKERGEGKP